MNVSGRFGARVFGMALVAAVAASLGAPRSGAAQERSGDCHCVDRDGNRMEDCVCLTTPSLRGNLTLAGFLRRSMIGVTIDYAQGADVDTEGAVIREVQPDGPADRAGLEAGDVVVRVDGRSVFDPLASGQERQLSEDESVPVQRFVRLVGALDPGEPVEFEVVRDGRTRTFTVTPDRAEGLQGLQGLTFFGDDAPGVAWRLDPDRLRSGMDELRGRLEGEGWTTEGPGWFRFEGPGRSGELRVFTDSAGTFRRLMPDSLARFEGAPFVTRFRSDPCFDFTTGDRTGVLVLGAGNCVDGAEFIELNPELGEYFGTSDGVLVARVAEESTLGLRAGDVLLSIDGREVRTPEHARRILSSYSAEEELRLRVMRKGSETEVLARRR